MNKERSKDAISRVEGGTLSSSERAELSAFIRSKKNSRTKKQIIRDELLSFQVRLLSYLGNDEQHRPTGDFLKEYIGIAGVKKSVFAKQLNIHSTKLSNLLSDKVKLNPSLAFKLEAHSYIMAKAVKIPAINWIRLQQKDELFLINERHGLRKNAYEEVRVHY